MLPLAGRELLSQTICPGLASKVLIAGEPPCPGLILTQKKKLVIQMKRAHEKRNQDSLCLVVTVV